MKTGIVKFFNRAKKFGFIRDLNDGKEYYVHAKQCEEEIGDNDKVCFELEEVKRGPQCIRVKKYSDT